MIYKIYTDDIDYIVKVLQRERKAGIISYFYVGQTEEGSFLIGDLSDEYLAKVLEETERLKDMY